MPEDKQTHKKIAEAALFVSGKSLSVGDLSSILGIGSIGYIKSIMEELIQDYANRDSALVISTIGSSYLMSIKDQYLSKVSNLAGAPDISKGALRLLAFISKNEPVMQSQLVKVFGTTTYEYTKELFEKGFINAVRIGRSKRLNTTKKFAEYFNLDSKKLADIKSNKDQ
ncbi:MAG: SMC-Scp complex subunit ScpB [Candidatus Micrarchaeia archaeon]